MNPREWNRMEKKFDLKVCRAWFGVDFLHRNQRSLLVGLSFWLARMLKLLWKILTSCLDSSDFGWSTYLTCWFTSLLRWRTAKSFHLGHSSSFLGDSNWDFCILYISIQLTWTLFVHLCITGSLELMENCKTALENSKWPPGYNLNKGIKRVEE